MKIQKPIFIIGSGRSGTTIFYNLLATHPELCWFSNYTDRFLYFRLMPFLHRIIDLPYLGKKFKENIINSSRKKYYIKPTEGQKIYHEYCGFKHSVRTSEKDLNSEIEYKFKELIYRHLRFTGKNRSLILKMCYLLV